MEMEMNHEQEQTLFWCHECDMSVSIRLVPPSPTTAMTPLLCPHCFSDLLELMDSTTHYADASAADDDQPQLAAISQVIPDTSIHQVTTSNISPSLLPASKAYVDSIPTVKMPSPSQSSCNWVCAVCKCDQDQDQDQEEVEVKQLPCNHIYHSHCILPWLSSRSSCPLCRFQLPTDTPSTNSSAAADSQLMQRLTHLRLQLGQLNTTTNRIRNLWYTNPLILDTTAAHSSFNGSLQ